MKTTTAKKPAKTKLLKLITRHHPECENDFLRFQFGIEVLRPLFEPIYRKGLVVDYAETDALAPVFHLLGFGDTESAAKEAAITAARDLNLVQIP
jgi:hypothetical protein